MFIFFLLSVCFAAETTYTIGAQGNIVIQIDKEQLEQKVINKCVDAKIFRFQITKDGNALKFNLFSNEDCSQTPAVIIDMTEAVKNLPPIQEEITLEADVKIVIGFPYGCLLKYLPEINKKVRNEFNYEFVHTQFGADIHSFSEGECEGIDKIQELFANNTELIQDKIKMILTDVNETVSEIKDIAQGAINMFEVIKKELYEYKEKLPSILDEYIYEFNGKVMKIYKVVEEKINGKKERVITYLQDAIIPKFEDVIGKLVDESGKTFNITADCDPITGNSFGYYDGKLQMTTAANCNFDINGFNLNFRLNISGILGLDKSMWINDVKYFFTEVNDYAKDLSTKTKAIVESFGSNIEFDLNECKPIEFDKVLATFTDLVLSQFDNYPKIQQKMKEMIETAEDIHQVVKEIIEEIQKLFPWFEIPTYGYKIGMLKTGNDGKNYATYSFYHEPTCAGEPMFEFVIGVVTDLEVKDVETGFELTKYLDQSDCNAKKGAEGYYSEHVQVDKCVNGFKYEFKNGELKMISCGNTKQATQNDETVYKCDTCVECLKQQGVVQGDFAFVTCGSSSLVLLLAVFLFFILF